jgi:hypothetical protein
MKQLGLLAIIGAIALGVFGYKEWKLAQGCKADPQKLSCADLGQKGHGDNAYVVMNEFIGGDYVYYQKKGNAKYESVLIPAIPLSSPWVATAKAAHDRGQPLPPIPASEVRVIIKATSIDEAGVKALVDRDDVTGVVINRIESIGGKDKDLLGQIAAGLNPDACQILEVNRTPASAGKYMGMMGGAAALLLVGGFMLVKK